MMDMNDPMMLMFGILASAAAGGAAGFIAGTTIGKTRPATPLPATIERAREELGATCSQLDKASDRLASSKKHELAGGVRVLTKRIQEMTTALGRVGHKAKQEGGA